MKVLMSIHPEYVEKIINNEKKYEFRKRIFKKDIEEIVVYTTSPIMKIECTFEVDQIIEETPNYLWNKCHNNCGISKKDFFNYFKHSERGYAIKIKNVKKLEEPINLKNKDKFIAPQSFRYISEDELNLIRMF